MIEAAKRMFHKLLVGCKERLGSSDATVTRRSLYRDQAEHVHRIRFLERVTAHFSRHAFTHSVAQGETESVCHSECSTAISVRHVYVERLSLSFPKFVVFTVGSSILQDSQRLRLQLEEVCIIALARPLAGVSLTKWPIQPKTQNVPIWMDQANMLWHAELQPQENRCIDRRYGIYMKLAWIGLPIT